jgi:hypothetical protein
MPKTFQMVAFTAFQPGDGRLPSRARTGRYRMTGQVGHSAPLKQKPKNGPLGGCFVLKR